MDRIAHCRAAFPMPIRGTPLTTWNARPYMKKNNYAIELALYHNVGRRYIGMARMSASRNTFSKPPNSQTKEL